MLEEKKNQMAVRAAELYYCEDLSQQRVAEEMGISRPSVSRLLQRAKEKGYVHIHVMGPREDAARLSAKLKEKYGLNHVEIAAGADALGRTAAEYLDTLLRPDTILGLKWGKTMLRIAEALTPRPIPGMTLVQLKGGISHDKGRTYADEILAKYTAAYGAKPVSMPLPVMFDTKEILSIIKQDKHIRDIFELGRKADIAIFTVGTLTYDALLFQLGYIGKTEQKELQKKAAGDICSRFFDADGKIVAPELDSRTVGIDLESLGKKKHSILAACGAVKLTGIDAALRAGFANELVTDADTAGTLVMM